MSENKTINRLISKVIFAGLLSGTLPMSLPLRGQSQRTAELKKLRQEVAREIAKIKKTVNGLRAAKFIVPGIIVGSGIVLTVLVIAVVVLFVLAFKKLRLKKLRNDLEQLGESIVAAEKEMSKAKRGLKRWKETKDKVQEEVKRLRGKLKRGISQAEIDNLRIALDRKMEEIPSNIIKIKHETAIEVGKSAKQQAEGLDKKIENLGKLTLAKILLIASIPLALFGLVTTVGVSIGSVFGLSAWSVSEASKGAKKIERIKRMDPGILTAKQKSILAQFKKLLKDTTIQGIIKNLRLEDALRITANAEMLQHSDLVKKLGGEQKARKTFTRYIKLKYQEGIFEKVLAVGAGRIKRVATNIRLKSIKKKIRKLEGGRPELKTALNKAVRSYTTKVNEILEELGNEIMEAAEKGELKPEKLLHLVVPL